MKKSYRSILLERIVGIIADDPNRLSKLLSLRESFTLIDLDLPDPGEQKKKADDEISDRDKQRKKGQFGPKIVVPEKSGEARIELTDIELERMDKEITEIQDEVKELNSKIYVKEKSLKQTRDYKLRLDSLINSLNAVSDVNFFSLYGEIKEMAEELAPFFDPDSYKNLQPSSQIEEAKLILVRYFTPSGKLYNSLLPRAVPKDLREIVADIKAIPSTISSLPFVYDVLKRALLPLLRYESSSTLDLIASEEASLSDLNSQKGIKELDLQQLQKRRSKARQTRTSGVFIRPSSGSQTVKPKRKTIFGGVARKFSATQWNYKEVIDDITQGLNEGTTTYYDAILELVGFAQDLVSIYASRPEESMREDLLDELNKQYNTCAGLADKVAEDSAELVLRTTFWDIRKIVGKMAKDASPESEALRSKNIYKAMIVNFLYQALVEKGVRYQDFDFVPSNPSKPFRSTSEYQALNIDEILWGDQIEKLLSEPAFIGMTLQDLEEEGSPALSELRADFPAINQAGHLGRLNSATFTRHYYVYFILNAYLTGGTVKNEHVYDLDSFMDALSKDRGTRYLKNVIPDSDQKLIEKHFPAIFGRATRGRPPKR